MNAKILVSHRANCFASEHGGSPWFFAATYDLHERAPWHENRDALGRRHPEGRRWVRLKCNDPDCPAEVILQTAAIEDLAERELGRLT